MAQFLHSMDHSPVAPGTTAAQALVLRGSDPPWHAASTYPLFVSCAQLLFPVASPIANSLMAPASSILRLVGDYWFVADAGVREMVIALEGPTPLAASALIAALVAAGLDLSVVYPTQEAFHAHASSIIASLPLANLPAGMLLTAAGIEQKEVAPGGAAGAGGRWSRAVRLNMLSNQVPSTAGLVRTSSFGKWAFFTGGTHLSASRDPAASHYRQVLSMLAALAVRQALPFADAGNGNEAMAARAAVDAFLSITGRPSWLVGYVEAPNMPQQESNASRLAQLGQNQMLSSRDGAAFLAAVSRSYLVLDAALPGLTALLVPMPSGQGSLVMLVTMLHDGIYPSGASSSSPKLPANQAELEALTDSSSCRSPSSTRTSPPSLRRSIASRTARPASKRICSWSAQNRAHPMR